MAINAVPGGARGGPGVRGPVLVPVNLLPFYMFRLISLSGFLHDTINFDLAKLFNDIQCNSILISSKTDHFEILPLTNHFTGDDINLYRSKFRCPTLGAPLLKKVPQVPQVPQSGNLC